MKDDLLKRYEKALNHIGIKNLTVLPDAIKRILKEATNLEDKVRVLETIELTLKKQGLI